MQYTYFYLQGWRLDYGIMCPPFQIYLVRDFNKSIQNLNRSNRRLVLDHPTWMVHQHLCIGIWMWGNLKPGNEEKELKLMQQQLHIISIHIKDHLQTTQHGYPIPTLLGFLDPHHPMAAADSWVMAGLTECHNLGSRVSHLVSSSFIFQRNGE